MKLKFLSIASLSLAAVNAVKVTNVHSNTNKNAKTETLQKIKVVNGVLPDGHVFSAPFRVVTLNVNGLWHALYRSSRITAIARYLAMLPLDSNDNRSFDVVALQELFLMSDFDKIKTVVRDRFPHSHYFYSGAVGSGLAVFSRFPIVETWFQPFLASGRPQRIFDGDWFAGKGVGVARIIHPIIGQVDIFNTHLIANYSPGDYDNDRYKIHRATQLYETVRMIDRLSNTKSSLTVLVGDLNTQPFEDSYLSMIDYRNLYTSSRPPLQNVWNDFGKSTMSKEGYRQYYAKWLQEKKAIGSLRYMLGLYQTTPAPNDSRQTFNDPGNSFYTNSMPTQQIDHIFYLPNGNVRCSDARVVFKGRIRPDESRWSPSFSDHYGLLATFHVVPVQTINPLTPIVSMNLISAYSPFSSNVPVKKVPFHPSTDVLVQSLDRLILSLKTSKTLYAVGTALFALLSLLVIGLAFFISLKISQDIKNGGNGSESVDATTESERNVDTAKKNQESESAPLVEGEEQGSEEEKSSVSARLKEKLKSFGEKKKVVDDMVKKVPKIWILFGLILLSILTFVLFQWFLWMSVVYIPMELASLQQFFAEWTQWRDRNELTFY